MTLKWEQTFVAYSECGQYKIEIRDVSPNDVPDWTWTLVHYPRTDFNSRNESQYVASAITYLETLDEAKAEAIKLMDELLEEDKRREELRSAAKYPVFTFQNMPRIPYSNMPQMRAFQAGDYILYRGEYLSRAEANRRAAEENRVTSEWNELMKAEAKLHFDEVVKTARDSINYVAKYGFKHDPDVLEECRADEFSCPVLESNVEKQIKHETRLAYEHGRYEAKNAEEWGKDIGPRACEVCGAGVDEYCKDVPTDASSIEARFALAKALINAPGLTYSQEDMNKLLMGPNPAWDFVSLSEEMDKVLMSQDSGELPTPSRPVLVTNILPKEQSGYDQILAQLKREASEVEL